MSPEAMLFLQGVFRWLHFVAGIIWIGLLYFFNFVNVPYTKAVEAKDRAAHVPKLMPLALAWFRYGALVTVLAGFVLIYLYYWQFGNFFTTDGAKTIFLGMLLGFIMFFNVWVFIWPNQKKIIAATVKGEKPDPQWGKVALYASRANVILSFPMLLYMAGATHFPMDWLWMLIYGAVVALIAAWLVLTVQK
jgi:uncharacterized membrane protein